MLRSRIKSDPYGILGDNEVTIERAERALNHYYGIGELIIKMGGNTSYINGPINTAMQSLENKEVRRTKRTHCSHDKVMGVYGYCDDCNARAD